MKIHELRIGNLINDRMGNVVTASPNTFITPEDMKWDDDYDVMEDYLPIQLTLDDLLSNGFVDDGYDQDSAQKRYYKHKNTGFTIYTYHGNIYHFSADYPINYVHQLQNIFFAIKYQEINLNL